MTTPSSDLSHKDYIKSDRWYTIRELAYYRAGFKCELCNSPDHIQAHHRDYNSVGHADELANLTVLCSRCHFMFHKLIEKK